MKQNILFNAPRGPKVAAPKKRARVKLDEEILELMNRRQRQILVHSNLYYRQNTNIIPDSTYDAWSHELADLIQAHPREFRKSTWYRAFQNFDGNTGMDLPITHPWVEGTATHLLNISRREPK